MVSLELQIKDCGLISYREAYTLQKSCVDAVIAGGRESLLLCEHPAVITLGRMTKPGNLFLSAQDLEAKGISVLPIDRGGDVTLHAPGQLVVYPILNLSLRGRDLKKYIHELEEVAIDFLKGFGIVTSSFPGRTGVWLNDKKIVSLGIGVKKWVSYHGLGINLNTDLNLFKFIRPCGLDVSMASVQSLTGQTVDITAAKVDFVKIFQKHFE